MYNEIVLFLSLLVFYIKLHNEMNYFMYEIASNIQAIDTFLTFLTCLTLTY